MARSHIEPLPVTLAETLICSASPLFDQTPVDRRLTSRQTWVSLGVGASPNASDRLPSVVVDGTPLSDDAVSVMSSPVSTFPAQPKPPNSAGSISATSAGLPM